MDILQMARLAVMQMMGRPPQAPMHPDSINDNTAMMGIPNQGMPGVQHGGSSTAPMSFPGWVNESQGQDAYAREAQTQGLHPARMNVMQNNMGMGNVDPQGMDPEMAALMAQEQGRLGKARAMYAPQSMGGH